MANYVLGLGGNCCTDCVPDDPCSAKPTITVCGSGSGAVGVEGTWSAYTSGTNLADAEWSISGAPSGITIDAETGYVIGTPTEAGTFTFTVTATNECGSASCTFTLTVTCTTISGSYNPGEAGIAGADYLGCFDDGCSTSPVCFGAGTPACGGISPDREPGCQGMCGFTVYLRLYTTTATTGTAVFKFYVDGVLILDTGAIGGAGSNSFTYSTALPDGVKSWCMTVTSISVGLVCNFNVSSY